MIILLTWLLLCYLSKQDLPVYQFQYFIISMIAFSIFMYIKLYPRRYLISIIIYFNSRKHYHDSLCLFAIPLLDQCNMRHKRSNKAQNTELSWPVLHLDLVQPEQ